jgi:acyl carrier protein phosphodiesterase
MHGLIGQQQKALTAHEMLARSDPCVAVEPAINEAPATCDTAPMNFLAHALLAGDDPALIVGGVVGDWIKGPLPGPLPADLARGVALHRAIDSHAESHPAFRASRARVSPTRRRYAGIFVDIFYDHLLARDWAEHHPTPLADYCAGIYRHLANRLADLPPSAHHPMQLMACEDWLHSYADLASIADVLQRMAKRARQPNPLAGGEAEFIADADGFAEDFRVWLGDARQFATGWR